MAIWNWLFGNDVTTSHGGSTSPVIGINPATNLPMIDGCGGIDVAGSPYGVDLHYGTDESSNTFDWGGNSFGGE